MLLRLLRGARPRQQAGSRRQGEEVGRQVSTPPSGGSGSHRAYKPAGNAARGRRGSPARLSGRGSERQVRRVWQVAYG